MAALPEKKESNTISMVVEKWTRGRVEQTSLVHCIKGYPFRLRLSRRLSRRNNNPPSFLSLICEKSRQSVLWKCTTNGFFHFEGRKVPIHTTHCSWYEDSEEKRFFFLVSDAFRVGETLLVDISTVEDGESWRLRPNTYSINDFNGILVIGEDKKEIHVNKEFLASLSPYFDRLFFGNFKEKNMDKIPIGEVEYEEFRIILTMIYGPSEAPLTNENVSRVLDLADRFELKFVEDKVVNYLLSDDSSFSLAQILLLSQEKNLPLLRTLCLEEDLSLCYLSKIKKAPEYADFSYELKAAICDRMLDLAEGHRGHSC